MENAEAKPRQHYFNDKISIYHSAGAQVYTLSDICGIKGMQHECIHSSPS